MSQYTRWTITFALLALVIGVVFSTATQTMQAQETDDDSPVPEEVLDTTNTCTDLQTFIADDRTPYDLNGAASIGGGVLSPGNSNNFSFPAARYVDVWGIVIARAETGRSTPIALTFEDVDPSLSLEFALFDGMNPLIPFRPVTPGVSQSANASRDGTFNLIVRRVDATDTNTGNYRLRADFEGGGVIDPPVLRDESINANQSAPPQVRDGRIIVNVNEIEFDSHGRAITSVGSRGGGAAQVFFGGFSLLVNGWAENVTLLGGDLVVRGEQDGRPRLFYFEDYAFGFSQIDGDLLNVTDADGNRWRLDWNSVNAAWVTSDCAAFKLDDGRAFITTLDENRARAVRFTGNLDDFLIEFSAPEGNSALALTWDGIISPVTTWNAGVFRAEYTGNRQLEVAETGFTLRRTNPERGTNATLDMTLNTRNARAVIDWQDIDALAILRDEIRLTFNDGTRTQSTRPADGLRLFEALEGVIRIDYDATTNNPVDEILMLPASDSFLEIITPANPPAFDGRALPGEPGHAPRALNNTGAECYPFNTIHEAMQCPPNGHINPANGNLWYAVTDLSAYGGDINLTFTRSYNSALAHIDGPLGRGWTTPYRLDYDVPYDAQRNSRPITPEANATFPVGLDLTHAPQGIVTFYTPSGSRHVFNGPSPFVTGTLRALTMPNWTLTRPDFRTGWTLTQPDGLTYTFDRAGRILSYGYPARGRVITIAYPGTVLEGTAGLEDAVIISDALAQRQLELSYSGARITEATLRGVDGTTQTTRYIYDAGGNLIRVEYADGGTATYAYDEFGRMVGHDDPRAPVATAMSAEYPEEGGVIWRLDDGDVWQALTPPQTSTNTVTRTLTDYSTYPQSFTYAYSSGTLREVGDSYTLLQQTTRLADSPDFEALPIEYVWVDGLVAGLPRRAVRENVGRNTLSYEYNSSGYLVRVRGAYPALTITYDANNRPIQIDYADGTSERFSYDDNGFVVSYTDKYGGQYLQSSNPAGRVQSTVDFIGRTLTEYTYNEQGLVTQMVRGTVENVAEDTITYEYDNFGRIITLTDALIGTSTITYEATPTGLTITLNDAINAQTITDLDHHGRILRQRIVHNGDALRDTSYTYDRIGRLLTQTQQVNADTAYVTAYAYSALDELPPIGDDNAPTVINGYVVAITDAYGRTSRLTYDGRDRLRQYADPLGNIERYDYLITDDPSSLPNGLLILERRALNERVYESRTYRFNLEWQLRSIVTSTARWEITTEGGFLPRALTPTPRNLLNSVQWESYANGRATSTRLNPAANTPNSPLITLNSAYDYQGRPTTLTDNAGVTYGLAYCPLPDGGTRTVYALPGTNGVDCDSADANPDSIARTVTQDAAGRLVRVQDANGERAYTYTARDGGWLVSVRFDRGYAWTLTYDAAGDLTEWTDENADVRAYDYDGLGRLIRVETRDIDIQPEGSFSFSYNAADQLTLVQDDLGRGTRYDYDSLGRLIVAQDIRNANATVYGYNADGLLATVISPLGNTTTYLYQDANPTRVTDVITPTGATFRFAWDDENNALTFFDPRNAATSYRFDGNGLLWQVQDALERQHDLITDPAGRLSAWRISDGQDGLAFELSYPSPDVVAITAPLAPDFSRTFTLAPNGQVIRVDVGASSGITLDYDAIGRLALITAADGREWTLGWRSVDVDVTLPDGSGPLLSFDALNRLIDDGTTQIEYGAPRIGEATTTVSSADTFTIITSTGDATTRPPGTQVRTSGTVTNYIYTPEGLLGEITFEGCVNAEDLAANGLDACLRGGTDAVWRTSERVTYDPMGRPIRYVDGDQNVESFAYDDAGNLNVYQDAAGRNFDYSYDALNRLVTLTGPTGTRLLLSYDGRDRVTGLCRARAENAQTYAECASNPARILETYSYDSAGRLTERRTADGTITVYRYDAESGLLAEWGNPDNPARIEYDALGLPTAIITSEDPTVLDLLPVPYQTQLLRMGDDRMTYDDFGRLSGLNIGGEALRYEYNADNLGFAVLFGTGELLTYSLDERLLLTEIASGTGEIKVGFDTFLNPDGRIILTDTLRADGQLIQIQRDRLNATRNNAYFDSDLLVDNTFTPGGLIQRQSLIGAVEYFIEGTQDYITVIGYDNDNRPITMRISDRANGQRVYLLTFTYDAVGRRQTETRQYRDDTQVTVNYAYSTADQLISQTIAVARPGQETQTKTITYTYDDRSNLTQISDEDDVCREFVYDAAGRLVDVRFDGRNVALSYDALNRVRSIASTRIIYHGDTSAIMATLAAGTVRWYGEAGFSTFFQVDTGRPTWLIQDGRGGVLATTQAGETTNPLWLFDPLGRFLSLVPPEGDVPCIGIAVPDALATLSPLNALAPDMLWDANTGLYIARGGRAYAPEIGVYLQRDPLGPDVTGNTYSYPNRRAQPPIVRGDPAYMDGLYHLQDALNTLDIAGTLNAQAIISQHRPAPTLTNIEPMLDDIQTIADYQQGRTSALLDLPAWLNARFNTPTAYRDEFGGVRIPEPTAPVQGNRPFTPTHLALDPFADWLPDIGASITQVNDRINAATRGINPPVFYLSAAWHPTRPTWAGIVDYPTNPLTATTRPSALADQIPQPLMNPAINAASLDAAQALMRLPERGAADWLVEALSAALPDEADLPPADMAAWLARWFSTDALGVGELLGGLWPDLPPLNAPFYDMGFNP